MNFSAVIFDLDGTLLDTLQDIADSANRVLETNGFPIRTLEAYRHFIGDGVSQLFFHLIPESYREDDLIQRCGKKFREVYGRRWNVHTRPYEGIPELLDTLSRRNVPTAVLSNKPHEFTVRCVNKFLAGHDFRLVLGQRDEIPRKPDPAGAQQIIEALSIPAERMVYLGDTAIDVQTSLAAGMFPVGVLWGFRSQYELEHSGARAVIAQPMELLKLLD